MKNTSRGHKVGEVLLGGLGATRSWGYSAASGYLAVFEQVVRDAQGVNPCGSPFFALLGVGASVAFLVKGLIDEELMFLIFIPLCVPVVLEGLRGRVEVDTRNRNITSVRALRTSRCAIDDVMSIRVPAWGPVSLVLGPIESEEDASRHRSAVITALYTDKHSSKRMYALAELLNVPLSSGWQNIRWSPPDSTPDG